MDFLLSPNFSYLVIVVGFLLTIFAILTPGTGIFELGAFFAIVIAGWQIYNLSINVWALFILGLGLVPLIFAIRQKERKLNLGLTTAAFVFGSVFLFRGEEWYQPAVNPFLATVVTVFAGGLLWMMTNKILEAGEQAPSHDLKGLIGAVGEARTDVHQEGSVYVLGEMWTAHSAKKIKAGTPVEVVSRQGFMLEVKPRD